MRELKLQSADELSIGNHRAVILSEVEGSRENT
jgi:hypothetical protein